MKDSRGKHSWTLTLVFPAWVVLIAKFAVSGVSYNGWSISAMDPIGFSTAFVAIMGPWLYRERVDKNICQQQSSGS